MLEKDPSGKSQHDLGAKLDFGKAPIFRGLIDYFPRAVRAVAEVSAKGAAKYAWKGWEAVPDGVARYSDALGRHLVAEPIEGPYDSDTGLLHKAQVAWNALATLELYIRQQEANYDTKRVSGTSEVHAATQRGFDLRAAQSGGGSGGATLTDRQGPPQGFLSGQFIGKEGDR